MGASGKRTRGGAGSAAPGPTPAHESSFGDEVLETRDAEFAAARRSAKRQKLAASAAAAAAKKGRKVRGGPKVAEKEVEEEEDGGAAPARLSAKILGEARRQREEVREEEIGGIVGEAAQRVQTERVRRKLEGDEEGGSGSDSEDGDVDGEETDLGLRNVGGEVFGVEVEDGEELTEADELAMAMFAGEGIDGADLGGEDDNNTSGMGGRIMLADVILAKIREKAEADEAAAAASADPEAAARSKKIAEVYGLVGNILARYKSGRVPKAFKVVPKMHNWEDLMYLTRPDEWSPAAMYAATRLFASNLKASQVVSFYEEVLLPSVLQDISENKKLNYHLYRALKKAVYKPDAFNKGILFPLCSAGGCSLREATIVSSVLSNVSIPMLHSAAALLYIAEQPYCVSNSVFIHALLNKKYALPYRAVDSLVTHFTRMRTDNRSLPLCWHISLLTFARRYKTEMEAWQKDELKLLMRVQTHPKVTAEIRRELFSARCRGEMVDPDANSIARAIANAS